ncbi:MAG TPA: electron transport complex subunit RsxC [Candidatus Egerieimonas intestinavium]|uniref:Ion-translocating oxidoreductase complex subunit C n=1 Tax=Candidatus Egerieimonas intestinavium TaxID=2840777 RepID=A0A9D1EJ59_9FIRM|nr:electron transport complex subunit RsxC [Candidatus Egerieimonas intestinavium]
MQKRAKGGFPGGIHPADGSDKALTRDKPVQVYWPETVTILTEQTPGGKCRLLVQPGDRVQEGELIAEPESFLAAPLHASVGGEVLKLREVESQGRRVTGCIIRREQISPEGQAAYEREAVSLERFSRREIIEKLREGGLAGMGGAGFPTYKKYETSQPIEALLINGAECEPFLTCDYRLMVEQGAAVVNGARLLLAASGASRAYLCLEDNKPGAVQALRNVLEKARGKGILGEGEQVDIRELPTRYPQGGERQLIQSVLGREVPAGGLPADVGVIVSNVGTARAAADAVLAHRPLTRRIVTVTGLVREPGNFLVPIGTSARELIALCGGVTEEKNRVIAGGPMTGACAAVRWDGEEELFPVTKGTSGILVLREHSWEEQPCIRCGGCARVCPAGLVPYQIEFAYQKGDADLCEQLYASECIACGCCSYICPARRELTWRTRQARDLVKERRRERAVKQG